MYLRRLSLKFLSLKVKSLASFSMNYKIIKDSLLRLYSLYFLIKLYLDSDYKITFFIQKNINIEISIIEIKFIFILLIYHVKDMNLNLILLQNTNNDF